MNKLAIVIPYFKIAYFDCTLQSLKNQNNKNFKVYIGNDASSENPCSLIEKYNAFFEINYHRFEKNLGSTSLVQHWERCIHLTEDESWIMILGDDDMLSDNVVQIFYQELNTILENNNKVVRFASMVINELGDKVSARFVNPKFEKPADSFFRKFKAQSRSSLSEFIFLKSSFQKYRFKNYPLAWHSDDMAWLDFSDGSDIFSSNNATVFIRKTEHSISGNMSNVNFKKNAIQYFFKDLVYHKLHLFSKEQKLELIYSWEQKIKWDRQPKFSQWFKLGLLYLKNFKLISFVKFTRRLSLSIFRK
jgi:glycosyltransferase involved in cell wall biosynthesis